MLKRYFIDLMDDEEEVLLTLAEILGTQFLDYVGGPAHALHVVKILEKLCQMDESAVRDKVSLSLRDSSLFTLQPILI